jgi:glycosyltransferase involved in cell wall biosynthesis
LLMKLYGMLRIKNEARWIRRVLESIMPICESVLIFDDHSNDDTWGICKSFEKVNLLPSPFVGLNEARDKDFLISEMEKIADAGDWILAIDGDEELEAGGCEKIAKLADNPGRNDCFKFQILYLWDRPNQIRIDRWYADFRRPSLFRLHPGARFTSGAGGGFHCGNAAGSRFIGDCDVKLLHWGYMNREDRIAKYHWYNAPDKQPIPPLEDGYRHMVVGDLFPADSSFRWAGPLELKEL